MVRIEINIPDELAIAFPKAVAAYNTAHSTPEVPSNLTNKQMLLKLLRDFTKDTLHAAKIETANKAWAKESENL